MTRTHRTTVAREDRLDGVAEGRGFGGLKRRSEKREQNDETEQIHGL